MTKLPDESEIVKGLTKTVAGSTAAGSARPIGDLMRQAQQRLVAVLDAALREAGYSDVGAAHVSVLATIDGDGTRLVTLAERRGRSKQATAQLATHLLQRGYVRLEADAVDGRAKLYLVTDGGRVLLAAAERVVIGYERWLDRLLGRQAIDQLRQSLTAIIDEHD